ncbi:hypothetical protein Misp02_66040 [Microtetraspora sp. NBRC 16547]|nr:hypothetical protein Misp02_66040 [Microtetraspora sp. NBRC 16547]
MVRQFEVTPAGAWSGGLPATRRIKERDIAREGTVGRAQELQVPLDRFDDSIVLTSTVHVALLRGGNPLCERQITLCRSSRRQHPTASDISPLTNTELSQDGLSLMSAALLFYTG